MKQFILGFCLCLSTVATVLYFTEVPGCIRIPPEKGEKSRNGGGDGGDSGAGIICTHFRMIMPGRAGKAGRGTK